MIGCLQTRVRKHQIIALYFELEYELKFYTHMIIFLLIQYFKFYNLEAMSQTLINMTVKLSSGARWLVFDLNLNLPFITFDICSSCLLMFLGLLKSVPEGWGGRLEGNFK